VAREFHDLETLVLDTFDGIRQCPRPRKHSGIRDGCFVVQRVVPDERDAFHHMRAGAVEIPLIVQPGPAVAIGGVDHQRIALPVPPRVLHPQPNVFSEVRTPVRGNDALGMVLFEKHRDICRTRRLNDPKLHDPHLAWHAPQKTPRVGIHVIQRGRVGVVAGSVVPFR